MRVIHSRSFAYDRLSCGNFYACASVHVRNYSINACACVDMHACDLSININERAPLSILAHASESILTSNSVCLIVYVHAFARICELTSARFFACGDCSACLYVNL